MGSDIKSAVQDCAELLEKRQADRALAEKHNCFHPPGRMRYWWHPTGEVLPYPPRGIEPRPVGKPFYITPDIEPYQSPVDGRAVGGRAQRREDMKRSGCVEYDPTIRRHDNSAEIQRSIEDSMHRAAWAAQDRR